MQMELHPSEHVPEWLRVCHVEALFWLAKEQTLKWKDSDYNIIIQRSSIAFTASGKREIQVEKISKCETA